MITHFRQAIEETLPWLSSFGADPTGGMTRLLYSPEWLETQQQFKKRMAASGLETRFDEVGNLYGRLSGTEYPQEVVLSGSHIDTVVNGGNLDGQFGALAAWLAIDWLKTQYGAPLRTVEVVAMAEEEGSQLIPICAKLEADIAELDDPEEKAMFMEELGVAESGLDRLIRSSYALLGLISFLTAGSDECRAWTIKRGTKAPQAAGKIHTDFERGFIRAEVIKYADYVELGSERACRDVGKIGIEGKEYVVEDGDIMHFLFNV